MSAMFVSVSSKGVAPPAEFEEEFVADPNGETLTLDATMQPLLLKTMTKSKDGFLGVKRHPLHLCVSINKIILVFFLLPLYFSDSRSGFFFF